MFQTFDVIGGPQHGAERAQALRAELAARELSGFMLPRADEFQNEYVAPEAEHLLWLTGFSGSWGTAVVLAQKAVLFIDGRYTLQAATQVDRAVYEIVNIADQTIGSWFERNLNKGDRLGFDPRLHTISQIELLRPDIEKAGAQLVPVEHSPIAAIWRDRPAPRVQPVEAQPLAFAGRTAAEKIAELQTGLAKAKRDAVVLSALDSIAWLFNIRGRDLPHTPFVHTYAIVPVEGRARLFIDGYKIGSEVRDSFADAAEIAFPEDLSAALTKLGESRATVQLDPASASFWLQQILADAGAAIDRERDPCVLPKARKNKAEIEGSRAAHLRDGAAVSRFLAWVDAEAPKGGLDEIAVAMKLEEFRLATNLLRDISFDTIAGSGPNGAIVHYRPSEASNRRLDMNSLLLIDSGGQYQDGTTDITRTVVLGTASVEMVRHYTLVLKGHIAVSTLRFPKGTRGTHIDVLARRGLWDAGLDYDHGTGHGVGSFLSVHEGPQSIARRESPELEPGMILSNEPGYYRPGQYGIRIENLVLVKEPENIPGGERPMMSFETLTLAPYDRRLIDTSLLSEAERAWIDAYHARVFATLSELVDGPDRSWLEQATAPLAQAG
jgi:Xaa-Pro aminopeptidase